MPCAPQVSLPTQYNNRNQDPVGALSNTLARLQANKPLRELREFAKGITKQLPSPIQVRCQKRAPPLPSIAGLRQISGWFYTSGKLSRCSILKHWKA